MNDPDPELATAPIDDRSEGPVVSTRGPGFVLAVGLAVVFAVVAAVLAAVLMTRQEGGDDLDELREVAGRFGEVLVTYDYHDPDAHKDAVLALASGSFRQDYEDAFDQGLGQIITQVQAVSRGRVNDVFLTSDRRWPGPGGRVARCRGVGHQWPTHAARPVRPAHAHPAGQRLEGGPGHRPELPERHQRHLTGRDRNHDDDHRSARNLGTLTARQATVGWGCLIGEAQAYDPGPSAPRNPPQRGLAWQKTTSSRTRRLEDPEDLEDEPGDLDEDLDEDLDDDALVVDDDLLVDDDDVVVADEEEEDDEAVVPVKAKRDDDDDDDEDEEEATPTTSRPTSTPS